MSASSNCVTRGIVVQLPAIRWPMTLRSCETGFLEILPHWEKSIRSGTTFVVAAAAAGCAVGFCSR